MNSLNVRIFFSKKQSGKLFFNGNLTYKEFEMVIGPLRANRLCCVKTHFIPFEEEKLQKLQKKKYYKKRKMCFLL